MTVQKEYAFRAHVLDSIGKSHVLSVGASARFLVSGIPPQNLSRFAEHSFEVVILYHHVDLSLCHRVDLSLLQSHASWVWNRAMPMPFSTRTLAHHPMRTLESPRRMESNKLISVRNSSSQLDATGPISWLSSFVHKSHLCGGTHWFVQYERHHTNIPKWCP